MSILSKIPFFGKSKNPEKYQQWSSPAPWRNDDGVYVGHNGQAWIYRTLDLSPVKWEDNEARIGISKQLDNLLADLGQLSKVPVGNLRVLANNREVHLSSVTWQEILTSPEQNPPELADFQSDAYGVTVPRRALFIGVRLVQTIVSKDSGQKQSAMSAMQGLVKRSIAEDLPQLELYKEDIQRIKRIFDLYEAKLPTREEYTQLESWFNQGMGTDVLIEEQIDRLIVADQSPIQFSACRQFDAPALSAPTDQWLMDTLSHPGDAPHMINVRFELEPTKLTRDRARMQQRRIQANIEEEQKSGDIEKVENTESYQLAKDFEDYLTNEKRPILSNASILMAREITDETETYMDFLDNAYGIQMTTLEHRQILALDETLPTSNTRVNPFLQDLNVPMIASAGLQAFSQLGDDRGCFAGFIDPDGAPLFIDPSASSRQNLPPGFGVFGDPGSGKSSPVGTPVFTPEGVVTMGDLQPGDVVFGLQGDTTTVTSIHPQGELETYAVMLADGRAIETSDEHLWHVAKDGQGAWQNRELKTIMGDLYDRKGNPKWYVPTPRPLQYPAAALPVDPYAVGAAAAAGAEALQFLDIEPSRDELLLLNAVDIDGSLPEEYLTASVEQREALLQGVMDMVGSTDEDGDLRAMNLHPTIAHQVREIVWSLGGVAVLNVEAEPLVDLYIEVPSDIAPFRVNAPDEYVPKDFDMYTLPIVGVEKTTPQEHVCITVDAEDHLYVSGSYVVTHNTFFAQNFATQCVLYGMPVFFINPKAADALDGLCDYINDSTSASADKISMMKAEEEPGAFDPFRFSNDPLYAAEVASTHIQEALNLPNDPLKRDHRLSLESGLRKGAEMGAKCVWDALDWIADPDHREYLKDIIDKQMDGSSLFALGIAKRPMPRMGMSGDHLTLVHFDREIGLPDHTNREQYSVQQRIALAAIKLVTKAALEILIANKGGVLVLDEAWTFLSQPEALSALNRISREGRSLNIVPVFLTQKIKDVITSNLEDFLSRVLVLKLNSAEEARTAFRVCGLKPTKQRLEMLRNAGPKPPKDGKPAVWAQGMFRDLSFRHSWVALGPTPEDAMKAWSTNPDDKRRFEEAKQRELAEAQEEAARQAQEENASAEELQDLIPADMQEVVTSPASPVEEDRQSESQPDMPVEQPSGPPVDQTEQVTGFKKPEPAWKKQADLGSSAGTEESAAAQESKPGGWQSVDPEPAVEQMAWSKPA